MLKRFGIIVFFVLAPMIVFAAPRNKGAEPIHVEVVSTRTEVHGSSPHVFSYTAVMFARVDGKQVIFVCDQRGDACPLLQSGKTYDASRVGDFIYISMSAPDEKKPAAVRYKQTGSW